MKTGKKTLAAAITVLAALTFTVLAHAHNPQAGEGENGTPETGRNYTNPDKTQGLGAGGGGPRRHEPPREAIDACEGKNEGDKVEFETPHGDIIKGLCVKKDDMLFAVPEDGRRPPLGGGEQGCGNRRK